MNKQKLANGMMWISMSVFFIFTAAITIDLAIRKKEIIFWVIPYWGLFDIFDKVNWVTNS